MRHLPRAPVGSIFEILKKSPPPHTTPPTNQQPTTIPTRSLEYSFQLQPLSRRCSKEIVIKWVGLLAPF